MTIAATTVQNSGALTNGAATSFSFNFRIQANGDVSAAEQLEVTRVTISTGSEEILSSGAYSVTPNGDQDSAPGGSVTITPALASGYRIFIRRAPNYLQSTRLTNQGAFNASMVEHTFDQVKTELQDLLHRMQRAPHLGVQVSSNFNGRITGAATPGSVPYVNNAGDGFALGQPSSVMVSTALTPVVQASTLALSRDALHIPKVFHVKDYGAACDAVTVFDGVMSNGGTTLTCTTSAPFESSDVGKLIGVMGARTDNGSSKRPLIATITGYTSASEVTLSASAEQAVSSVEVCFGTDDSAKVQLAVDAADAFGGGRVYVPAPTVIGSELDFGGVHHVQLCSDAFAHAVDETGFSSDLAYSLSQIAGKLIWLGADGGYVVTHDVGQWEDGSWVKPQGNGFTNICVDCFGRAAGVLRSFSALSTRIHRLVGARFTVYGLNIGTTSNAVVAAALGNTASSYGIVSETVMVNRGAPVYGAKSLAIWGDKGDSGGNSNYWNFSNSHFVIENDGALENISVEQVDTTDFVGCVWNARMVLHAADTGTLSLYNLIHPNTELITDAASASSTTVTLPVGFYALTVTSGTGGTAAVTGGTATTANTGTASNGTPDEFEVTVAGTVTITRTGTLTAWSLKARNRNCQSRTVSLHSCSGLVVAKKSALGAGFHAQNHYISGYDVENIVTMPIIEPGANVYIESNARTDQSVGALQWGGELTGLQVALTSNQTIADSAQSSISWPTPTLETLDLWDSGATTRVTFGHASNAHQANNVLRARFDAQAAFASSSTGYRFLSLLKNGTTRYYLDVSAGLGGSNITVLNGTITLPVSPGDYFELQVLQDSTGNLDVLAAIGGVGDATRLVVTCF